MTTQPTRTLTRAVVLVTSAELVVLVRHDDVGGVHFTLPPVPAGAGDAARYVRTYLRGEISGLRFVGSFVDGPDEGAQLWSARIVGHAPRTWALTLPAAGGTDRVGGAEDVRIPLVEVAPADLRTLDVRPAAVALALREALSGPQPLAVLLGIHAVDAS